MELEGCPRVMRWDLVSGGMAKGEGWEYRQRFLLPRIHVGNSRWSGRVGEGGQLWEWQMEGFKSSDSADGSPTRLGGRDQNPAG